MNEHNIQIGKYTLESLTTGMYNDSNIIYREYIQNSVDALENAILQGIIEKENAKIQIIVNEEDSSIIIKDNGTGIKVTEAVSTLLNIGNSKKRHSTNRGFRGIGRLVGMSFCDYLVFTTSFTNENTKSIITFDCKKLRELLIPGKYEDMELADVINEVTTVEHDFEDEKSHYFSVELKRVKGMSNVLELDYVKSYISQVAPVPYKIKKFIFANELRFQLESNGYFLGSSRFSGG